MDGVTAPTRPTTLPAISLWQPYASLISAEAKPWETRHWPAPPRLIGKRIAIHAAARKPTITEIGLMASLGVGRALGRGRYGWELLVPYGAIVCTVRLMCCWRVFDHTDAGAVALVEDCSLPIRRRAIRDDGFGDYSLGRYCWELGDVRPLAAPMPLKGRQGWFKWTPPAEAVTCG